MIKPEDKFLHILILTITVMCTQNQKASSSNTKITAEKGTLNGGILKSDKTDSKESQTSSKQTTEKSGIRISNPGAIANTNALNAAGPVEITSDRSITNGSPTTAASINASSVALKAPIIHNAGTITARNGSVNISTSHLVNSGSITAKSGDVNITSGSSQSIEVENTNGSITGKSVSIKKTNDTHLDSISNSNNAEKTTGKVSVKGGTITGDTINIGGNNAIVDVDAEHIDGKVKLEGSSATIRAKHGAMQVTEPDEHH